MRTRTALLPLLVLASLALGGCGPTPPGGAEPHPGPPADTTPTVAPTIVPLPEPTVEATVEPGYLDRVTSIQIQTEGVYYCDVDACGLDGFYYFGSQSYAVDTLTEVFGTAADVETVDAGGGQISEYHDWGGFAIYFYSGEGQYPGDIGVVATTGSIGGVAIEAWPGVRVGTSWAGAAEVADSVAEMDGIFEAHFDTVSAGPSTVRSVIVFGAEGEMGPVTQISAPITTGSSGVG